MKSKMEKTTTTTMQKICAHVASQASCQASVSRGRGVRQVSWFELFTHLQKAFLGSRAL